MLVSEYFVLRDRSQPPKKQFGWDPTPPSAKSFAVPPKPVVEVLRLGKGDGDRLKADPQVLGLAPQMPVKLIGPMSTSPTHAILTPPSVWGLEVTAVTSCPFSGNGIVVAVLDTGIDITHPAFQGCADRIEQKDFTGEGDGDSSGHGTHCAATIFGGDVGGVRIGIARGFEKALVAKVFDRSGNSWTKTIVQAVVWALNEGAHVISMSLGFDFPGQVAQMVQAGWEADRATSAALSSYRANLRLFEALAAMARAVQDSGHGAVLVAAAGNESKRDVHPEYTINVATPAAADGFIAVGALQMDEPATGGLRVAPFSNSGPAIAAPGVDIISAQAAGGLTAMSGTSMATPHVAGIFALWVESEAAITRNPSVVDLSSRVLGNARPSRIRDADSRDVGTGLVQAPQE